MLSGHALIVLSPAECEHYLLCAVVERGCHICVCVCRAQAHLRDRWRKTSPAGLIHVDHLLELIGSCLGQPIKENIVQPVCLPSSTTFIQQCGGTVPKCVSRHAKWMRGKVLAALFFWQHFLFCYETAHQQKFRMSSALPYQQLWMMLLFVYT